MASADAPSQKAQEEGPAQNLNIELRRALNNAYAFVLGEQSTQSFNALTYEELADEQIERIEGPGTEARPNALERIDLIERDLENAIEQIRSQPPEAFILRDESQDVNTSVEPAE